MQDPFWNGLPPVFESSPAPCLTLRLCSQIHQAAPSVYHPHAQIELEGTERSFSQSQFCRSFTYAEQCYKIVSKDCCGPTSEQGLGPAYRLWVLEGSAPGVG